MRPETVISANSAGAGYWRELWRYRELFLLLAWRDLLVRYKQTLVGVSWAVLRPLLTMVVFTVVFGRFAKLPSGDAPYPLLVLAAVLPWQFFSGALAESGTSLLNNSGLISKVYFPRMVVPASAVLTTFVDFLIAFFLLAGMMLYYQFVPDSRAVFLPLFAAMAFGAAAGGGLWISALTVRYRDFRIVTPFLVQFGFFVSPVGYSSAIVPDQWRLLYSLNPLVGIIDGFRWALLRDSQPLYLPAVVLSLLVITGLLLTGIMYFRRTERSFADVI